MNACGRNMPRETVALIKRSGLFPGVDSGPMHLAAKSGSPTVVLFSARGLPGKWYPLGNNLMVLRVKAPCWGWVIERSCPHENLCMKSIDVDTVSAAVADALKKDWNVPSSRHI